MAVQNHSIPKQNKTMKKYYHPYSKKLTLLSLCAIALAFSGHVCAAVIYTSTYDASALPTDSSPLWFGAGSGTNSVAISNGTMVVSTMSATSANRYWAIGTSGSTVWGASTAWNTGTATVDFRISVSNTLAADSQVAQGFWMQLTDTSNRFWNFYIGNNVIYSNNQVNGVTTAIDIGSLGVDTSIFNTYRIAMSGGVASLYINDIALPVFSNVSGVSSISRTAIMFGDAASFQSSSYVLDYINWSNTVAEFSAPIPEPGTAALFGISALFGFALVWRRSCRGDDVFIPAND